MTRRTRSALRQSIVETAQQHPDLTLPELAALVTGRTGGFATIHQHVASLVGNGSLTTHRDYDADGFVILRYRAVS